MIRRNFLLGLLSTPALVRVGSLDYVPRARPSFSAYVWRVTGHNLSYSVVEYTDADLISIPADHVVMPGAITAEMIILQPRVAEVDYWESTFDIRYS